MKVVDQDVNYGAGTIKLVLQFPDIPQDDALTDIGLVQKEIRAILNNELQEHMKDLRGDCR